MPSRIIKESICTSENLAEVSAEAERLFWRLVTKADDFGRYYGNAQIISSMCFPISPPGAKKVSSWLTELVKNDLILWYTAADEKTYLQLSSWEKHQQRRAAKSKFPEPLAVPDSCNQPSASADSDNRNQMIADSLVFVNENVFDKRKREACPKGAEVPPGFDRFWSNYPRRVGKKDAIKAWRKANPDESLVDLIVASVERWKRSDQWTKDKGQFIPYPATFLRGERWNDNDLTDVSLRAPPGKGPKNYDGDEDFLGG